MVIVNDIIKVMEGFAPTTLAEGFDNVGLMVGDERMEVNGVLLTLDVTSEVVREAVERGVNMIVSHHPLIFSPLKSIIGRNDIERAVILAIQNGVAIYSAHTNADSTIGGVSYTLAEKLVVNNLNVISPKDGEDGAVGLGVYGELDREYDMVEYLTKVKEVLGLKSLRYSDIHKQTVRSVALCGGSGASFIGKVKNLGVDLYLTGDIKYHDYFSTENELTIADIGHFESEICILDTFYEVLTKNILNFVVCKTNLKGNPINYL